MKANEYNVLEHAVEIGLNHSFRHAFKHDPNAPELTDEQIEKWKLAAKAEVMISICEWFKFN